MKKFNISKTSISTAAIVVIPLLLFIVGAWKVLVVDNSEVLFMAQSRSFFNYGSQYLNECREHPAGILSWISTYFTQFFYEPALGAGILIALWVLTTIILKYAFRLKWVWYPLLLIPVTALLASDACLGYWIYYIKLPGYLFANTLGFLAASYLTWKASQISRISSRLSKLHVQLATSIWCIIIACTFPWLGIYSLLALALTAIITAKQKQWIPVAVSIICIAFIPGICYNTVFTSANSDTIWMSGLPVFDDGRHINSNLYFPYVIAAVATALIAMIPQKLELSKQWMWKLLPVVYALMIFGAGYQVNKHEYWDLNYKSELAMYRAVDEQRWEDALSAMEKGYTDPTREMVLLKNISLANLGRLGEDMFRYPNTAAAPYVFDSLDVHLVQTAGPLIYLHHGRINFAHRWCVENGVESGFSYQYLKIMSLCALVNGEYDAARKYLNILTRTIYYKEWAEDYLAVCDKPKLISQHHELDKIRELHRNIQHDVLDSDDSVIENYITHYFAGTMNKDSKYLQELTLIYAMVTQDIQAFWPRFFAYATLHQGEDMPIHYQEAAYLYGNLEHNVDISFMPFDEEKIKNRYKAFMGEAETIKQQGASEDVLRARLKSSYGDTFWWFYFFCRNISTY